MKANLYNPVVDPRANLVKQISGGMRT
ncbi:hypothetical protein CCP2SC5_780005 [Azospirillaceae bacterium]